LDWVFFFFGASTIFVQVHRRICFDFYYYFTFAGLLPVFGVDRKEIVAKRSELEQKKAAVAVGKAYVQPLSSSELEFL
jgi:hypothetical protein